MEAVKKSEDKIELDPNEWMNWNDDKFNEWRRSHDFPRIVEFLYDSLPSFGDWLSEQDGLSKDDLLFHGPARFVRYYGQRINYVEHDISISIFSNSPVPPAICYEFIQSDELETRLTKTKCIKRVEFLSYIDWAIYKKVTNIESIISFLTPGGRTSQDRHYLNSHSNIQFNIPLHMPNRFVNSPFWVNNTAPPKLELLKLGGKNVTIDDGYIGEKNLEFTNLDNLTLLSPMITSFQQFTYCTLHNFSVVGGIHAATFHQCSIGMAVKNGSLAECRFEYGSSNINLDNSSLSRCTIKEKKLSLNLIASEIVGCHLEYKDIVANSQSHKQAFHKTAKVIYSRLGYPDLAGDHFLLEQTAKRKKLWQSFFDFKYKLSAKTKMLSLFSSIWMYAQEVYWGYGEKPFNIIRFILFLITSVSLINFGYCESDTYLDIIKSLTFTFQSFTNITIVEIEQNNRVLNLMSAFLSFFGLVSVGLLVASLSAKTKNYN
ncbi:hypothetical protein [Vibrio diabolicus]|uniref:hypothetical protein n=1 Tax=Vibrio diabolicus TaxID=50719 RepID=UPI00215E7CD3|nr:hypothetical protein [Vibrio diabolicus]MCS0348172.1 hypothetical protein [Vibrio diabolicus]MCS0361792.1 hypothetical protein [Vibrio diabolicus]MCS0373088.1 hypothetical protein [Vibrio diabolicus]MCS0426119.1 hypothetical protein [Vibrio diabolicus]MCS0438497.1 hypothetical protein [Vibrio diabolicus]